MRAAAAPGLAAQQRADARGELVQIEGLDEVVVGARIQALHAIGDRIACGDDEHRQRLTARAQRLQQLQAVAPGQPQIEQQTSKGSLPSTRAAAPASCTQSTTKPSRFSPARIASPIIGSSSTSSSLTVCKYDQSRPPQRKELY